MSNECLQRADGNAAISAAKDHCKSVLNHKVRHNSEASILTSKPKMASTMDYKAKPGDTLEKIAAAVSSHTPLRISTGQEANTTRAEQQD